MVDTNLRWQATERGFPETGSNDTPWLAKQIAKPGTLDRIRAWEASVRKIAGVGPNDLVSTFMNASQNADRSPPVTLIPALITNSQVWSMNQQRFMLIPEMFEVQGFAMFARDSVPERYMCPFRDMLFQDLLYHETRRRLALDASDPEPIEASHSKAKKHLTHSDYRRMVGNSMSLQCLGAVIMFALAYTRADHAGPAVSFPQPNA